MKAYEITFLLVLIATVQVFCWNSRQTASRFSKTVNFLTYPDRSLGASENGEDMNVEPSRRTMGSLVEGAFSPSGGDVASRIDVSRRRLLNGVAVSIIGVSAIAAPQNAGAMGKEKSRTESYAIQKTSAEWRSILSPTQYDILRNGATERPSSSILESEKRSGIFCCAGCDTPLFDSKEKFNSRTGWPSFASALAGVEVEDVGALQAKLGGAELRCGTCGGHLGDVFQDGFLFVGTPAFTSGKRFCIDGAALVFRSEDGAEVVGDTLPPPKPAADWLEPPKIKTRDRYN